MRKLRRSLAIMMAMVLCLSLNTFSVFAAESEEKTVSESGITCEITNITTVPASTRASHAAGNSSFLQYGEGTLILPAHTSVSKVTAFARLANGNTDSEIYIDVGGAGFSAADRVFCTAIEKNLPSFNGIANNTNSVQTYHFTFWSSSNTIKVGIALFFE